MRKRIVSFLLLLLLGFAGLATATIVGDLLRAGIDITGSGIVFNYDSIELEGATEDAYETSVAVTDPTADRTITIPDSSQTLGTATTIQDDLIVKADFADEDWGDLSVSTNNVTLDSGVVDSTALETDASLAELNALDQSDATERSTAVTFVAKALYDVTGGDSGTVGAHGLGVTLPDNSIVLDGVVDVITTFTDGADDSATIALSAEGANDIVTATAISGGSNIWDAGLQDIIPDGAAANMIKTTAAQEITATVADDTLSAGKLWVILRYMITE